MLTTEGQTLRVIIAVTVIAGTIIVTTKLSWLLFKVFGKGCFLFSTASLRLGGGVGWLESAS